LDTKAFPTPPKKKKKKKSKKPEIGFTPSSAGLKTRHQAALPGSQVFLFIFIFIFVFTRGRTRRQYLIFGPISYDPSSPPGTPSPGPSSVHSRTHTLSLCVLPVDCVI
jgi:hypothetical protein